VFLRAIADTEFVLVLFHVALQTSYSALPMATLIFRPDIASPVLNRKFTLMQPCRRLMLRFQSEAIKAPVQLLSSARKNVHFLTLYLLRIPTLYRLSLLLLPEGLVSPAGNLQIR
jgi:hypothetical protein